MLRLLLVLLVRVLLVLLLVLDMLLRVLERLLVLVLLRVLLLLRSMRVDEDVSRIDRSPRRRVMTGHCGVLGTI